MTIVRVGTTQKYASGWEKAFGKGSKGAGSKSARNKAARSAKKAPGKLAKKKTKR